MKLSELMRLPWSWEGPARVDDPDNGAHFEIRIRELPDFFVAGSTRDEALAQASAALASYLQSYLDHGEIPPLPVSRAVSWVSTRAPMPPQRAVPAPRQDRVLIS